jgi:hypothetical protein
MPLNDQPKKPPPFAPGVIDDGTSADPLQNHAGWLINLDWIDLAEFLVILAILCMIIGMACGVYL